AWRPRAGAMGTIAVVVAGMIAFTVLGPLQPGWARRAGTPSKLLAPKHAAATTAPSSPSASSAPSTNSTSESLRLPFSARVDGTLTQTGPDTTGSTVVVIDARLRNGATGRVHVALQGDALAGGGITMQQSRAYLGTTATPSLYAGTITSLNGTTIVATLRSADGHHAQLTLELTIDATGRRVTGVASARSSGSGQ
ncbi:MAG: hypothetical protein QOI55_2818, partial [Actinomycetota bacterium]|nr:hypothetical protein [Actinomycetota bacterium]